MQICSQITELIKLHGHDYFALYIYDVSNTNTNTVDSYKIDDAVYQEERSNERIPNFHKDIPPVTADEHYICAIYHRNSNQTGHV